MMKQQQKGVNLSHPFHLRSHVNEKREEKHFIQISGIIISHYYFYNFTENKQCNTSALAHRQQKKKIEKKECKEKIKRMKKTKQKNIMALVLIV